MLRRHGTHACFVHGPNPGSTPGGCSCRPCRDANAAYEAERKRRTAPAYVGAANARRHLAELADQGVGLKSVAKVSGLSHGGLSKLVYGDSSRNRGPSKRIRRSTEQAILAVTVGDAPDACKIPAEQTRTHIATLHDRGWTYSSIATAIGMTPGNFSKTKKAERVRAATARAVRALLDQPVPDRVDRHGNTIRSDWTPEDGRLEQLVEARATVDRPPTIDPAIFDEPWRKRAACRLLDPADRWIFWPGKGDPETVRAALDVCDTCPVTDHCLTFALDNNEQGIWGGTTRRQRRNMTPDVAA